MNNNNNTLKINQKYDEIFKRYNDPKEYDSLKNSIKTYGQHNPIIVNKDLVILDGHTRFKICSELGIEPKYEIRNFPNQLLEELFVYDCNLERRNLTKYSRTEIELERAPLLEKIAKENINATIPTKGQKGFQPVNDKYLSPIGRVNEQIGKPAGISFETVRKVKKIKEEFDEDLKDKLRKGEMSIQYAFKQITRSESHKNTPDLPEGKFDIIVADPPWSYDINTRGSPDDHYDVMTNEDIYNLAVPSADNTILFLWATAPKLQEALNTMKSWGFKYKTNIVWLKDKIGTGYYVRGQHELILIGEKGDMPVPQEENRPPSVFHATRQNHSQKPDIVMDMIERMYPNRKYLELFSRGTPFNEKWTVWGNESTTTDQ